MNNTIRIAIVAICMTLTTSAVYAMGGGGSGGGAGAGAGMNNYLSEQVRKQNEAQKSWEVTEWIECPKGSSVAMKECTVHKDQMSWDEWRGLEKKADSQYIVRVEKMD